MSAPNNSGLLSRLASILMKVAVTLLLGAAAAMPMPPRIRHPQVISHRGACGYVPEHCLNAYQLAIDLGTDYIEPDLISSSDGNVICTQE